MKKFTFFNYEFCWRGDKSIFLDFINFEKRGEYRSLFFLHIGRYRTVEETQIIKKVQIITKWGALWKVKLDLFFLHILDVGNN